MVFLAESPRTRCVLYDCMLYVVRADGEVERGESGTVTAERVPDIASLQLDTIDATAAARDTDTRQHHHRH